MKQITYYLRRKYSKYKREVSEYIKEGLLKVDDQGMIQLTIKGYSTIIDEVDFKKVSSGYGVIHNGKYIDTLPKYFIPFVESVRKFKGDVISDMDFRYYYKQLSRDTSVKFMLDNLDKRGVIKYDNRKIIITSEGREFIDKMYNRIIEKFGGDPFSSKN